MSLADELQAIVGAKELYDWFGYWPRFHDAEIVSLYLNRRGPSSLLIHTWETTNKKVDGRGYFEHEKDVAVEFVFEGILELKLSGFIHQNVFFGLELVKKDAGFVLTLDPRYGLAGAIEAQNVSIQLKPGKPSDRLENREAHAVSTPHSDNAGRDYRNLAFAPPKERASSLLPHVCDVLLGIERLPPA